MVSSFAFAAPAALGNACSSPAVRFKSLNFRCRAASRAVSSCADKSFDVVVVGAGIIGLTSAIRCRQAGYNVRIVALETPSTVLSEHASGDNVYTSSGSGGYWMPFHATGKNLQHWCLRTFDVLEEEVEDSDVSGVSMHEGYILHAKKLPGDDDLPFFAERSGMKKVTHAEDPLVPPAYAGALRMRVPICIMEKYLPWLEQKALASHIQIERVPQALDLNGAYNVARQASARVLLNCTGIGAKHFSTDDSVTPGRGVTVRVRKPRGRTAYFITESEDDGVLSRDGLLAYCLPRGNEYTLGGTLFEGNWDTSTGKEEADALVQRCSTLIPGVETWERTGVWTGLRPLRKDGIRLDVESDRREGVAVVNNYGHGGSGVTACWGCAEAAVRLVKNVVDE